LFKRFYEAKEMKIEATKQQLIEFLESHVLTPVEYHIGADETIKRKVRATRMHLNNLRSAEEVENFFWNTMASDHGIDSYTRIVNVQYTPC